MFDTATIIVFLSSCLLISVSPGPFTVYVLSRSIGQGARSGMLASLGGALATLVHTVAAAFGLAALLMSSALAFDLVKYAGAAYLLYLGVRSLRSKTEAISVTTSASLTMDQVFYQSFVTGLLNPKVALFFLSYLPQFVNPKQGSAAVQIIMLGSLLNLIGTLWFIVLAAGSGWLGDWLKGNPRYLAFQKWLTGLTLVTLGVNAALSKRE